MRAFTAARLPFEPNEKEWDRLISGLEAWEYRDQQTVSYRKFLAAPSQRTVVSVYGIFPKMQKKEPSQFELDRRAKAAEEELKAQEKLEEDKKLLEDAKARRLATGALAS